MRFLNRNTVFSRLILTFMIVLTPLYVIGTGIYTYGISVVKTQILSSIENQVTFKYDTFESDILLIRNMINDYTQDDSLIKISSSPDYLNEYNRAVTITGIQRRLQDIKDSSMFIENIGICVPAIDRIISTVGLIDPIDPVFFDALKAKHAIYINGLVFMDGRLFLISDYPLLSSYISTNPLFMIYVELSVDKTLNFMNRFSDIDSIFVMQDNSFQNTITNAGDAALIDTLNAAIENSGQRQSIHEITTQGRQYLCINRFSDHFNIDMQTIIPVSPLYKPLGRYQIWFWVFSVLCAIVIIAYSFSTYRYIHKPMRGLTKAFKALENGDMSLSIKSSAHNEFEYLYEQFNNTVKNLRELIDQVYKQKILVQNAKLKYLQSQINPHFLYNTFFLLNNMVQEQDMQNIREFTGHLGYYFKYITRSNDDEASLADEVSHARTYLEIQQKRFGNRIEARMEELPERRGNIKVPRLILQPVIENIYEHGLKNKMNGGVIRIRFEDADRSLVIRVEDNGENLSDENLCALGRDLQSPSAEAEGTGIINIHKRLQLRFGSNGGIDVARSELGGLMVNIQIPIEGNGACTES